MQKQILVVEDNELNRAILREMLSDSYRVLEAENGQEALDVLHQHKDSIALILLDLMMPVMDGYTFLDRIREDAELSLIPVIVTTQCDGEEDEVLALSHGATDFVPKPYQPQVILRRVASLIKLRETCCIVSQVQYDRLTGLYSKEFFYQQVRERLAQYPEREYSLIFANVENFKLYNDVFGIPAGDRLLTEIADAFRKLIGETGICSRYRADRFVCLQERTREYKNRIAFGEDGRYSCIVPGNNVVMKWGIYEITDRTVPVELMCDRALLAVESIKGQYNKYYAVYNEELRSKLLREKEITDAMETALTERQFAVYFQPKYSLNDKRIAGSEALVRWVHPEWGMMFPEEFIPLFEKNGFIPQLDQYVWEQVCAQLRDWQDKGWQLLPVSVNVSRADVYQSHLADTFRGLIQKYGIDPMYLHLEITESAYAENPSQIISTVKELRRLGFIVEMDDFGSGYSSLNMLSQMTLDVLKLDMKFIQNEIAKPVSQSILNDVVSMAHRLHLSVVAEGVETREQIQRLREVECDYAQGYYFAKPMAVEEFEELWRSQESRSAIPSPKAPRKEDEMPGLLVVEEDAGYREKLWEAFAGEYQVLEASDTENAVSCVRSCGAAGVSAVILSMTLPEDGAAAVMNALRQEPAYWELPVLAAIPDGESPYSLPLAMEADDYYCKDHPIAVLQRRLRGLIRAAASQKRENNLQDQANRDQLTGLLNRRGLQSAMTALRKEDFPLAVYLFDLDNLKTVNDTGGHQTGDRMICSFADLLRRSTRSGDILCRYGGDEFLVVLKRLREEDTAIRKGEDVCAAFHDCFADETCEASCSAGVALCGTNETLSAALIDRADQALYCAKEKHKGGCCLWREP